VSSALTTLLELVGMALIAAALGLAFGLAAFLGAAGCALVVLGVVLEGSSSTAPAAEGPR